MVYVVKQKVYGKDYYYLRKSVRVKGKVISKNLGYLGKDKGEAIKKAEKIIQSMNKEEEKKIFKFERREISVEDLAMFCKRKGFVYPSSEIYGGFAGFWDFGFLGTELKNNIKKNWWRYHVQEREDITGIDGSIITNPKVWEASGHAKNFSDVFVVCKKCKKPSKIDRNELGKVKCDCGGDYDINSAKDFKLMFETIVGEETKSYLRPETAQLIFTNFKLVYENERMKFPFGIAQIGKSFRNEIAPRDFLFRSKEFEQMEMEYFVKSSKNCIYKIPDVEVLIYSEKDQKKNKEPIKMKIKSAYENKIINLKWHAYWLATELLWFKNFGVDINNFRIRQHRKDELAHYSKDCWDLEYKFPFGWRELEGIADRGNYDLTKHKDFSKTDLSVFDEEEKKKFLPEVVAEPSLGVERAFLVFMFDSYFFDEKRNNVVLKLNPKIAPVKASVFPIIKRPEFEILAKEIVDDLRKEWIINFDRSGSIGRRYARNDEIGTPYCITIDGDSVKNKDVTIRDRDTTKQIRVKIKNLRNVFRKLIEGEIEFEKAGKLILMFNK